MTTRADIVKAARGWLGTPYRHQARCKGVAVDCIGLVGGVALELGISGAQEWAADVSLHNYTRQPDPATLLGGCERFLDRVPVSQMLPGDVLVFSLQETPRHFALLTYRNPNRVIHAYALLSARRVVEQSLPIAKARLLAAFAFRGVTA